MDEPLDHIHRLQRSARFWRNTSLVLAAILLAALTTGYSLFAALHHKHLRAMDRAIQRELAEELQADIALEEAARLQAERAMQEAKERKD
jgi:hypothetical protein